MKGRKGLEGTVDALCGDSREVRETPLVQQRLYDTERRSIETYE
jgi:hypothetical protein